jgi:hypothetical protein
MSLSKLDAIHLFIDSNSVVHCMSVDYEIHCPWLAPILATIQSEADSWLFYDDEVGSYGPELIYHQLGRNHTEITARNSVANHVRLEFQRFIVSSGLSNILIGQFGDCSLVECLVLAESQLFFGGLARPRRCYSFGMTMLFSKSRDIMDCMWSLATRTHGTRMTQWIWKSSRLRGVERPSWHLGGYKCEGFLQTSTEHPDFRSRYTSTLAPGSGFYTFTEYRRYAMREFTETLRQPLTLTRFFIGSER